MPTYTFQKVELRATKSVKCDGCGSASLCQDCASADSSAFFCEVWCSVPSPSSPSRSPHRAHFSSKQVTCRTEDEEHSAALVEPEPHVEVDGQLPFAATSVEAGR